MSSARRRGSPVKAKKKATKKREAPLRAKEAGLVAARKEHKRSNNAFMGKVSSERKAYSPGTTQKSLDITKDYLSGQDELPRAKKRVKAEKAKLKARKGKSTGGRSK
jgi:hypothetical protein